MHKNVILQCLEQTTRQSPGIASSTSEWTAGARGSGDSWNSWRGTVPTKQRKT